MYKCVYQLFLHHILAPFFVYVTFSFVSCLSFSILTDSKILSVI